MDNIKHILVILLLLVVANAGAQIPAEVGTVVKKCGEKMKSPAGVEMDMALHVKALAVMSVNGSMKMYMRGDKSVVKMRIKMLGHEVKTETGSDGRQMWFLKHAVIDTDRDTLIVMPVSKKGEFDLDFNLHNEYRKAKMKEKNGRYEITFTDPKDKDMPRKTVMVVNKSDYTFHEMSVKDGANGFTMTVTRLRFGVPESMFVLDESRYQGAVVVKRSFGDK